MNANALLEELRILGVVAVPAGDRLRVRAPRRLITPKLRRSLAEHKAELLALLRRDGAAQAAHTPKAVNDPDDLPWDWREEWAERVAIRMMDGGQAREHAEAEALAEIIARMVAAGVRHSGGQEPRGTDSA